MVDTNPLPSNSLDQVASQPTLPLPGITEPVATEGPNKPQEGTASGSSTPTEAKVPEAGPGPLDENVQGPELVIPNTEQDHWVARDLVMRAAVKQIGMHGVSGGGNAEGPTPSPGGNPEYDRVGFDSSGLVQHTLAKSGLAVPHLSYEQLQHGPKVPMEDLLPGDLVGFGDGHHVAIYAGNDHVIEAPSDGGPVRARLLNSLTEDVWGVSLTDRYRTGM